MDSLRLSLTRSHPRGLTLVEQLVEGITAAVDDLRLKPGTPMPSVRNLAQRLGISTFTAAESYARLVAQNYLTAKRGSGYVVAARLSLREKSAAPIWQPPRRLPWKPLRRRSRLPRASKR